MPSSKTLIHLTALDGLINTNSLFTLAVFVGLAWNPYDPSYTLIDPTSHCYPLPVAASRLVAYHVYSFSSFLFSSLVALALKQAIKITHSPNYHRPSYLASIDFPATVDRSILRAAMLVSSAGSVCGCGFLMMALFKVVEIKLGTVRCGSGHSAAAVAAIFGLVPLGMVFYVFMVLYAFTR
ncbi:hypothetical protein MLD38_002653 [Melastoma candidum]|uniref:Uncharacterized protein n=1 Tax=Melastoma candidum TaxID=119954 RepID=A0ACB9RZS5_9MYRT|nr:hypothetical protein MLD38_002653 [Melastoma candidum]